jgi:Fibronectin type III domain
LQVKADTTQCTVKNLKPGHLYRFEVSAINKEGESLPIQTRDPVKAENPYSKCRFRGTKYSFNGTNRSYRGTKCRYM